MRRAVHVFLAAIVGFGVAVGLAPGQALAICPVDDPTCGSTWTSHLTVVREANNGSPGAAVGGLVTSDDGSINCGSTCTTTFDTDGSVTVPVTATNAYGWAFDHWVGCDNVPATDATCYPPTQFNETVTAYFNDADAPVADLTGTMPSSPRNSGVSLSGLATDNDAVHSAQWYVRPSGGVETADAPSVSSPGTHLFGVAGLADGTYYFGFWAEDYAGNRSGDAEVQVVIDKTAPSIDVTGGPADNATISASTATYEYTTTDVNGPVTTSCQWDTGAVETCNGSTSASGLSPGAHTVTITAVDAAGNSASLVRHVTYKLASSLAFPAQSTLLYGHSRTLRATLTSGGAALANQPVQLLARPAGSSSWQPAGGSTTSATGVASVSVSPKRTTAYEWTYAGDGTSFDTTSAPQTLRVAPVVAAKLTSSTVRHGSAVELWGTVKPGAAGQAVVLQIKTSKGWVKFASSKLAKQRMPNGTRTLGFVFSIVRKQAGTYSFRVVRAATSSLTTGTSATRRLRVT
jgi:hypothetical protein